MSKDLYKNIRPYSSEEVPPAIERMVKDWHFKGAMDYIFPKEKHQEIYDGLKLVKSNYEFQEFFMYKVINRILELSSDGFSISGNDNLIHNGPSVLIGNHRDILLDSAMLQTVLVDLLNETSEITFGSNLMFNDFIVDFGKVNRMFTVYREGSPRELLEKSKELSAYIHHNIQDKKVSSWIAQRKGRTKDGLDKTDTGVLKMLTMFDRKNPIEAFLQVNILPVSVSYEWEPCGFSKIREVYLSSKEKYVKQAGEDFKSVVNGIIRPKGKIHMAFTKPVNQFIEENRDSLTRQNIHQEVAKFIDKEIYTNYKLNPNNYLAYDLLKNTNLYSEKYDENTKAQLNQRLDALYEFMAIKTDDLRELYLLMYANPLIQKLNC